MFSKASMSVFGFAALALLPSAIAKPYPQDLQAPQVVKQVHQVEVREILNNATILEKRQCDGTACGWDGWLCCPSGNTCGQNANSEAICVAGGAQEAVTGGSWVYSTSTWVETGVETRTSVYSSWVGATTPVTGSCTGAKSICGNQGVCCDSGYYCYDPLNGVCRVIGGSSSPGLIGTLNPSAPLRPTASTLVVITATGSPTQTTAFSTPIPTGVNGTLLPTEEEGAALSGGAIAGIVIGVILGVILLLLLCLYCCAKTVFDGFAALLGFGKKKRHTHEETYIEEHHHHSGHGSAAAGGRRWYGQGGGRPSRPPPPKKSGGFGGALGVGAGLAGLAIALGLKRKHDRKYDDKSTTISGSSAYYSDYTSSSSASSSDRHTRPTRHSSRR